MSRRQGGVSRLEIVREWPHLVEVPATVSAGHNFHVVHEFLESLPSAGPQLSTSTVRRDDRDFLRFAFGDPGDAEIFRRRFGGRRLTAGFRGGRFVYDYEDGGS